MILIARYAHQPLPFSQQGVCCQLHHQLVSVDKQSDWYYLRGTLVGCSLSVYHHKVTVSHVAATIINTHVDDQGSLCSHFGSFWSILSIEKLWQWTFLDGMNAVVGIPRGVAGNDYIVSLNDCTLGETLSLLKNLLLLIFSSFLLWPRHRTGVGRRAAILWGGASL